MFLHIQTHTTFYFWRFFIMKKRHLLASLLALLFMVSALPITAGAYYRDTVYVYVDDNIIDDVDAYLDHNGDIRVSSSVDLLEIFPKELNGVVIAYDPDEGILVEKYIKDFGYSYEFRNYNLYIYTGKDSQNPGNNQFPGGTQKPGIGQIPGFNQIPGTNEVTNIYINGVPTSTGNLVPITIGNTTFYFSEDFNKDHLTITYSKGTTTTITNSDGINVGTSTEKFGYTITYTENGIYINNDGNSPIQVLVDGKAVQFPNQQPVIVDGRTLVPIRAIAEAIGCKVDWDAEYNRVIITKNNDTMLLWINSTRYWVNGTYYETDVAPQIINGSTMVPIRFLGEAFGFTVDYESGDVQTIKLSSR